MNAVHHFPAADTLRTAAERKNAAIVTYVADHGPCTFMALYDQFGDKPESLTTTKRFRACLQWLSHKGRLRAVGGCAKREWVLGHVSPVGDTTPLPIPAPQPKTTPAPKWVGQLTPSRQINWQHGGTYLPTPDSTQRPGSLDFAALPSRGLRC